MKRFIIPILLCALVATFLTLRWGIGSSTEIRTLVPATAVSNATAVVAAAPIRVHVFGTVRSVGDFAISKPSLAEALSRGVPYVLSDLKRVRIYRLESGVRVKDEVVDATQVLEPGAADVPIEDGDTIFVPEKII